ncbi:GNAT family N-acetyltransferase [Algihabitans albus]|uniref:GNAT family N-acetyltransferase n=1 Tax=Algihabitans albus TaxID=2164067 RepID=UPI0013C30165|nr:GNAT family N-acetyltransferase [Algihabitans albus]
MSLRPQSARLEVVRADYNDPQHAAKLVDLLDAYACDPMGGGRPLPAEVRARLVPELAARPQCFSLIGYADGTAAGLANCVEGFSTFAAKPLINIHDIAVLPAFRGRGLARALLAEVEAIARHRGACKLTLEVLEGNGPATAAYRRFGFAGYALDPSQGRAEFWEKPLA